MKRNLKSLILLLVAMLSGLTTYAQVEMIDLELDKLYTGKAFEDASFRFTAPETGNLLLVGNAGAVKFTDATFTQIAPDNECSWLGGFGDNTTYEVPVVAGEIYYIGVRNKMDNWSFTASMNKNTSVELVSTTPAALELYTLTHQSGMVVFTFNTAISVESVTASTGTTTVTIDRWNCYTTDVSIELKETVKSWFDSGIIKQGDKFTVTLTGVRSALDETILCNGDGIVSVEFICAGMPTQLTSESSPEKFLSFFSLNKEDGIIILTYDGELSTTDLPRATLGYGDVEAEGEYYTESLPVSVEGRSITVDLRGKRRIPSEMTVSGTDYGMMNVSVNNIIDINGNHVYADGQGNFGSWQKSFPYEMIAQDLTSEFVPASGALLTGVDVVELWLSNPDAISFNGVTITFKDLSGISQTVEYTNEQCNYNNAGVDGITLQIPITAEMQNGSNVTVTLKDTEFTDGVERIIEAIYNPQKEFLPISIDPANQSQLNALSEITITYKEGSVITIAEGATATIYSGNGRTEIATAPIYSTTESNVIKIVLDNEITETDDYRVVVPEKVLTDASGEMNEVISLSYQIVVSTTTGYVFDPEDGTIVHSLEQIIVSHHEGCPVMSWNGTTVKLFDAENDLICETSADNYIPADKQQDYDDYKWNPESLVIRFPVAITVAGKYTVVIPSGHFSSLSSNTPCPEITLNYIVDGQNAVESILDNNTDVYTVYNLQGIHILSTTDKADIYKLNTGFYIINGKKVYID